MDGQEGIHYYRKGEYEKALPLLQRSADSGNAESLYYLGKMHRQGKGVEENLPESCRYFLKAAEKDYRGAYLLTAVCYRMGEGVAQDDKEALRWGKKAAQEWGENEQSDEEKKMLALFMGNAYAHGKGTLKDFSKAAKWYEEAAILGDVGAQSAIAFFYYSGQGVVMNKEKARYWAEKATAQGSDMGELMLGMLHQFHQEPPDMKQAIYRYEQAARKGNAGARYQLGALYEKGIGVKPDMAKAHDYYRQAAQSGRMDFVKALSDFEKEHHLENTH